MLTMHLTAANLVHYLIARGCITAGSVVDGDFHVATTDRRNRCFRVMRGAHTGLFLKQIRFVDDDRVSSLHREAQFYRLAQAHADNQPLFQSMPRFVDYDSQRHVLIVELLRDSQRLNECYERVGQIPEEVGVLLGRAMGHYHCSAGREFCEQQDGALFRKQVVAALHGLFQTRCIDWSGRLWVMVHRIDVVDGLRGSQSRIGTVSDGVRHLGSRLSHETGWHATAGY